MNIFSWLGRKIALTDGRFFSMYYGADTWAGESISADTAMQIAAYWACVRLISETIGTCSPGVFQTMPDGSRKDRSDHDLYYLIHDQPNADFTAVEFWEGVGACLCLAGNAYAVKAYVGSGQNRRLVSLALLNPRLMNPVRTRSDNGSQLVYRYSDKAGFIEYSEDDIFHVRGFGIGGDMGFDPIAYARQSLSANRATERAAATTFANGMRPSGWLLYKGGILKEEQRIQARKQLIEPMQGAENAGRTGILEGDFDYKQMTIQPETAQLLETRAFGVEEVCRIMRVPPVLVGHASTGQTMFGSGVEQVVVGWYTLGLRPYFKRIEAAIKRSLLTADERRNQKIYAEFNIDSLLRGDSKARSELYWKLVQVGSLSPNQVCDRENLPRFEGGDRHFINSTLVPIDLAGQNKGRPVAAADPNNPKPQQQRKLEVVK